MKIQKALLIWLLSFSVVFILLPADATAQQEGERQMEEKSPDADKVDIKDVKRSPIRAILNKLTIGANVGYGLNHYRQKLPYVVMREGENHYLLVEDATNVVPSGYSNWLNNPALVRPINQTDAEGIIKGDSTDLKLQGFGHSLPIMLDLHVVIKDRFRIGGGVGIEAFSVRTLNFKNDGEQLYEYNADVNTAFALRYYGMLGARVIRWGYWDHSVDVRLGKKNFLTQFDNAKESLFFNAGFMMERNYSEYFRLTLRPSLEWFSYTTEAGSIGELKTNVPSLYLQAGISFNFPKLPRCPVNGCRTQLEHVHQGKEFRGQPLHRWQNPKYGQNHPELQRNLRRKRDDTEQRLQRRPKRKKGFSASFR